jgi:hypothetical protein
MDGDGAGGGEYFLAPFFFPLSTASIPMTH